MGFTGSMTIVVMLLRSRKIRLSSTYGRLMLGMSVTDTMQSLAYCFSTIPSPRDIGIRWPTYGTAFTCSLQGWFLFSGGTATTIYYGALCIYYVLVVTTRMKESSIKKKVEPYLHLVPLLYSITIGTFLGVTKHFNNAGSICWISPHPHDCRSGEVECTRGKNALFYRFMFQAIPIFVIFFIIFTCMVILICKVGKETKRMEQNYDAKNKSLASSTVSAMMKQRKKQKIQGLLYIAAYFITFIFPILFQAIYISTGRFYFTLFVLQQIFSPAQGIFNFMVYIRPILKTVQKTHSEISFFQALLKAIQSKGEEEFDGRQKSQKEGENDCDQSLTARTLTTRTHSLCPSSLDDGFGNALV